MKVLSRYVQIAGCSAIKWPFNPGGTEEIRGGLFWGRQEWAAGYRKGLRMGGATGGGRERLNGESMKAKKLGIQRGDP